MQFVRPERAERPCTRASTLRKACCGIRKLEPLARMLAGRTRLDHRPAPRAVGQPRRRAASATPMPTAAPSSTRWPTGPGPTSGTTSPRTTCPTTRCTTSSTRASAARRAPAPSPGRRLPRRPLVVGGRERQGMRPARGADQQTKERPHERAAEHRAAAARARQPPPRLARGGSDLHPARGRRRVRAARPAVLRRQGFLRRAAAGREGLQDTGCGQRLQGPPALPAAARRHRPQLSRGDRVPRPARGRDGRAARGRAPGGFDPARHACAWRTRSSRATATRR